MNIVKTAENLLENPYFDTSMRKKVTSQISSPFDIIPDKFLDFATKDLERKDEQGYVNALSNIKRSIECQIDTILFNFGFHKVSKESKWKFPYKINVLKKLDILSPKILERINSHRVKLEHFYESPSREKVEDALDVAILFIEFTKKYITEGHTVSMSFHAEGKFIKTEDGNSLDGREFTANVYFDRKDGILTYELKEKFDSIIELNIKSHEDVEKYIEWMRVWKDIIISED